MSQEERPEEHCPSWLLLDRWNFDTEYAKFFLTEIRKLGPPRVWLLPFSLSFVANVT